MSIFFDSSKPNYINSPRSLPRNPMNCAMLDIWVLDNLILANQLFTKDLQSLENCLSVNSKLCEKLVSLAPMKFFDNLRSTSVVIFKLRVWQLHVEAGSFYINTK